MLYWFLDLELFWINRARLYKDLENWDFQQIGELAQTVACRTWKSTVPGFNSHWGKILLLYFLFSYDSVESAEYVSFRKNSNMFNIHSNSYVPHTPPCQ